MDETGTVLQKLEQSKELAKTEKERAAPVRNTFQVRRDELGRFAYGHEYLPVTQDGIRNAARKAFLDSLNGLAGEKRLLRLAEIAEGAAVATVVGKDGEPIEVTPSIREQLDANTTLLYLQHGRPAQQIDVTANHTVKVRWNPDKYERLEDLEKYLELQRIGEVVDAEVVPNAEPKEEK